MNSNLLIYAIGWTLLHSVWQIGLLGLLAIGLERFWHRHPAQFRHNLLLYILGGMVLAIAFTLCSEWQYFASIHHHLIEKDTILQTTTNLPYALKPIDQPTNYQLVSTVLDFKTWIESHLFWVVWSWALGMVAFSLRFVLNYFSLRSLRHQSIALEDPYFSQLLTQVITAIGLRRKVNLRLSSGIASPLTFGFFYPIVLLPIALVAQTSPSLLEALLRHELIHIRRADFLVNLMLSLLQILFFYHPLIWMITRRVQELREEACDAAVLYSGCDNLLYAEALLQLQKLNHHQNIPLAMQAQNPSSHFATRLRQIMLRPGQPTKRKYSNALSGSILLVLLLMASFLGAFTTSIKSQKAKSSVNTPVLLPQPEKGKLMKPKSTAEAIRDNRPTPQDEPQPPQQEASSLIANQLIARDTNPAVNPNEAVLSVAADRMNVLYMGIDNPISVALSGVSADQVSASSRDVRLTTIGKGKYIARAFRPGIAIIFIEAPNYRQEVKFRVKPIPDPIAVLGAVGIREGFISESALKEIKGLESKLFGFDMDVACNILGFSLIYIEKGTDNVAQSANAGENFNAATLKFTQNAKIGDQYIFDNIRVKCPGDEQGRKINNIAIKVVADPIKE
jgi:beta-lactamase regulating signal transducer with metallopeptidase domain